jgi:hypothetical protein
VQNSPDFVDKVKGVFTSIFNKVGDTFSKATSFEVLKSPELVAEYVPPVVVAEYEPPRNDTIICRDSILSGTIIEDELEGLTDEERFL